MRDETAFRHSEDAPKGSSNRYKCIDQQIFPGKDESMSWYSTVQRRLSRSTSSGELGSSHVVHGACSWGDVIALIGTKGIVAISTFIFLLLLVSCTSTAMLLRSWAAMEKTSGTPGASKYLREIADWHEIARSNRVASAAVGMELSMRTCVTRVQLPEVQLPKQLHMVPAWQPNGSYPVTPLDELNLNCNNPAEASTCRVAAASSNLYEGETQQLHPQDLADLEAFLKAAGQQQEVKEQGSDPLAELAVDCTADPEACAAVVEGSNSYYASNPADEFDVAAEAAAYLQAVHAPNTWNAVIGATQKLGGEAPNTYEGVEDQWVQKRVAEEAGSQYLDASALDLDCSVVAGSANALECERTKAVNRYEAAPPTVQDPALLAAEMAFSMQQHQRIVGYDALAVDWADYSTLQAHTAAGNSCSHANVDHADETAETSLALHQHLQQIARQGRVTGYDAPAVDPDQLLLSAAGNAAAAAVGVVTIGSAGGVQRDELQAARQYYKNPCNCPNARDLFKNNNDHHGHRVYYKNPANAPIFLSEKEMRVAPDQQKLGGSATAQSGQMTVLAVIATFVASAVGTWYMMAHSHKRRTKPEKQAESDESEGLHDTTTLASSLSYELPDLTLKSNSGVPQHMPIRSPTMSMPLATINEPEDNSMENAPTKSESDAASSSRALIEGMTSGMLMVRESDSDAVLVTAPSMLQTRPSMLVDVQPDHMDSPRTRTPVMARDSPNVKGK